jgi:hypothetical protein
VAVNAETTAERRGLLSRAQSFAEARADAAVTTTHLLLAVMAAGDTVWPKRIVERGGLSLELPLKRLHWPLVSGASSADVRRYRASMRLTVIVVVAAGFLAVFRRWRLRLVLVPRPPLDRAAAEVLLLAASLDPPRRHAPDTQVGLVLLALATTPGRHLRLLDNGTVLACAARRDLGLDHWHQRLILGLDWPKLLTRRARARLVAKVAAHGRLSLWGLLLLTFRAVGLLSAAIFFLLTVPATIFLYVFLWPALILTTAIRSAACALARLETRAHKWYEIPGGEVSLAGGGGPVGSRRLAAVILIPRVAAFAVCVAALVFVGWRSQRLGVALFPTVFSRPDLLLGLDPNSSILTPFVLFSDALSQDGALKGIGLLAGLGAGMLSLPTYRELALVRLHAGHESGRGSRLGRILTLPASLLVGAFSCVEAWFHSVTARSTSSSTWFPSGWPSRSPPPSGRSSRIERGGPADAPEHGSLH